MENGDRMQQIEDGMGNGGNSDNLAKNQLARFVTTIFALKEVIGHGPFLSRAIRDFAVCGPPYHVRDPTTVAHLPGLRIPDAITLPTCSDRCCVWSVRRRIADRQARRRWARCRACAAGPRRRQGAGG